MKIVFALKIWVLLLLVSSCGSKDSLVLFSSDRNGNSDIFTMKMDGSSVLQLTDSKYEEWGAVWISQNEICFLRQLNDRIVRIKKDIIDGAETEIPHPETCILDDKNAIYQADTNLEAFTCKGEVYYKSANETVNLTGDITGNANYPGWTSNGNELIITSNHLGSNDIYSVDMLTKTITPLTSGPSNDERGELSSDGRLLAFSTDRFEKGNQDIALKDLQTGEVTRLTSAEGFDLIARWAGDNQTLLIGSNSSGNWEIYSLDINDKELVRLTNDSGFDGDPRIFIE